MPPKGKRAGRPIKKFPEVTNANTETPNDESVDLDILANAAQSVDFHVGTAWHKLEQATERLEHLKSIKTDRGYTKEKRKQLVEAINAFHRVLVAPLPILNNTPDLYKDEFKNRATALTGAYLQFCLDVAPKKDDEEKDNYLQMLLEKLIQPIREQPSLWGAYSLQITGSASNWEKLRQTVPRANLPQPAPQAANSDPPYPAQPAEGHASSYQPHYAPPQGYPYMHQAPFYPQHYVAPQGYPGNPPYNPYYSTNPLDHRPQYPQPLYAGQNYMALPQQSDYRPQPAYPPNNAAPPFIPSPIPPQQPAPVVVPENRPRDERMPHQPQVQDVEEDDETSTPMDIRQPSPPPLQRPKPVPLSTLRSVESMGRTSQSPQKDSFATGITPIPRHPAYSPEMAEIHGTPLPVVKIEDEDYDSDDDDDDLVMSSPPMKRPISVNSNDNVNLKRKRTENGVQHVKATPSDGNNLNTDDTEIPRPLSRQEIMYQAVAKEHEEDARFLADNAEPELDQYENEMASTPVLNDTAAPVPRRGLRRSMSRSDIAVVEDLTPAIREMMSPAPRESSPDRERWRTSSPPLRQTSVVRREGAPSHIRSIGGQPRSQLAVMPPVLPPGGNALGASSPEYSGELPAGVNFSVPRLEHSPAVEDFEFRAPLQRQILPLPTSSTEMPALMAMHDRYNRSRHVETQEFYIHKRTVAIAKGNESTKTCKDGTIRLGRYFSLTQEEIEETKEYLRFLCAHEASRPKTMIRLTCRPLNGEPSSQSDHAWPDNTMVFLNGKCLLTTMNTPLYIAPEELSTMNQIRVKVHPHTVQGSFAVYLEVYSLLSFHELKTFLNLTSPQPEEALIRLKNSNNFNKQGFRKARIPLMCGGREHVMQFPVYGKKCTHVERLDLSCFVQQISVGPDFEWMCPICGMPSVDEIPLAVDTFMLGILLSHKPHSRKEFFQLTSDGEICDDSESEEETESDHEESELESDL